MFRVAFPRARVESRVVEGTTALWISRVAHAGCNAVEGEQGSPQQFTAAVGAGVLGGAWRLTHGRLPVLIPQSLQQRNLQEAQGNDGAVAEINRQLQPLISAQQSVLARDFQNQFSGEFVFLGDHLEDRFKGLPLFRVPQAVHVAVSYTHLTLPTN